MAIYKNVESQKVPVYAYDADGDPKTGDAGNITARISKDGGAVSQTGTANPTELDAKHAKGVYLFPLTQAETNADMIVLSAVSETADIMLEPLFIFTQPTRREADVTYIDSNEVSGTGSQIADAFKHFFNVASTSLAVSDTMVGTDGANTTTPPTVGEIRTKLEDSESILYDLNAATILVDTTIASEYDLTTTTCRLTAGKSADDAYNGAVAVIHDGTRWVARTVVDYASANKVLTWAPAMDTEPSPDAPVYIVPGNTVLPNAEADALGGLPTKDQLLAYIQLLARSDSGIETDRSTEMSEINNDEGSGGGGYLNQEYSFEALRDRGDIGWTTATGFSTHNAAAVLSAMQGAADDFKANVASLATSTALSTLSDTVDRAVGLLGENIYHDNHSFDGNGNLTSCRIRIYSASDSVGSANDVTATYNLTATYDANGISSYKVTKTT